MEFIFYIASLIAIVATAMVIVQLNPINALLYLIVSLLAVALVMFVLGAPFAAALQVIIHAGAIVVLFVFVVMLLNLKQAVREEQQWFRAGTWIGPATLSAILLAELLYAFTQPDNGVLNRQAIDPKQVGIFLYGPYLLAVELASFLLLAALVGAYHLGRRIHQDTG